jgi:hypothetical protein
MLNRRDFLISTGIAGLGLSIVGCKKPSKSGGTSTPPPSNIFKISDVILPNPIIFSPNTDYALSGKGFAAGDKLLFVSQTDPTKSYTFIIKSATAESCIFTAPGSFDNGNYRITASRGTNSVYINSTRVEFSPISIPDKAGMTIKGFVHVNMVGLANVVVSDGLEVVKTDTNGIFYLPSKKTKDFVFVSIPSGYKVKNKGPLPIFYLPHNHTESITDTIIFELEAENNDKHVVLALGDMHLANRNNDVSQFQKGFLTDVAKTISQYKNDGYKVYGLTLGDMTWDNYWYSNNYSFPQYLSLIDNIGIPMLHTMGNHDNDPYVNDDWKAEKPFRVNLGPTYYSFNLGKTHYIVLDNIQYINTGGADKQIGQREYKGVVVKDQMDWLKKDLAMINDKSTPIVLAMHIQLNNQPSTANKSSYRLDNAAELVGALSGFSDVNVLTGHTHVCYTFQNNNSLLEHNSGALCATWWWTGRNGYAGNNTCVDGAPGGYAIWKFDNKNYQWLYKSIGFEENYQFRAYDLNRCQITAEKFAPKATETKLDPYKDVYKNPNNNNEILVNVWGYDTQWKVEVFEAGNPLTVTRVSGKDPLHIISYEAFRVNDNQDPTEDFCTSNTTHLFKAKANSASSSVLIKVTDRFGNVYQETMTRPKDLSVSMK